MVLDWNSHSIAVTIPSIIHSGGVSFYENWADQVQDKVCKPKRSNSITKDGYRFQRNLAVSAGLVAAAILLMKLLDRKWGRAEFNN